MIHFLTKERYEELPPEWRNGRRTGLKIQWGAIPVPVRVRPPAPILSPSLNFKKEVFIMSDKMFDEEVIILEDEDGNTYEYLIRDFVEVDDKTYVLLTPKDAEDMDEIYVYRCRLSEKDGELYIDALEEIEDDDEFEKVVEALEEEEEWEDEDWEEEDLEEED